MRRFLKITIYFFTALIIFAALFLWLFDFSHFKTQIEAAVTHATGRNFQIQGDLSIRVLPRPKLLVEHASLASPPWSADPHMLEIGRAKIEVGFWSFFIQPIVIRDFELEDVRLLLM